MSSPNAFIGDPLFCYREGQSPVSISCPSLEELIYLSETKEMDKQEVALGEKTNKDNSKNSGEEHQNEK
jgi:hypothetical protein